jgi:hypothetical protein
VSAVCPARAFQDLSFRAKARNLYEICVSRFHVAISKASESVKKMGVVFYCQPMGFAL